MDELLPPSIPPSRDSRLSGEASVRAKRRTPNIGESDTAVRTEHCEYRPRNKGCDLFPSCLRCPLPKCRYDNPGRQTGKELRNREMVRLHKAGMEVKELAQRFGVSKRTVHRIIAPSKTSESDLRRTGHNGEGKGAC